MLTWAEWKSETGPDSNNFAERTITFDTPCPVGRRCVVMVNLYTTTGVDALAAWISDSGGHTWVQDAGLDGDGSTGGVAILSTEATSTISSVTLDPGGTGNYATWGAGYTSDPAELDSAQTGSGSSTSPAPTSTLTSATTDGVACSVISTRNQGSDQTQPATWSLEIAQPDNSTDLAGALAYSGNISSAGNVASTWTIASGTQWYFAGAVYKASAPAFDEVTRIMGGTDGRGWGGNEALGGADSVVTTTFDPPIPAGFGIIVCLAIYGYTPSDASLLSIDGSGNSLTLRDQISYGGGVGGSVNFFDTGGPLTSDCSEIEYDATSLPGGDNGRYIQMMFYAVENPDPNGFKTATGITRVQTTTTTIDPTNGGANPLIPPTTDILVILGWTNRGHSEDLLPLDVPAEFPEELQHSELHVVTSSPDEFGSVHNSITQSGSFIATRYTAGTPYSPVVTFEGSSPTTSEARMVLTAYNIAGGTPVVGGSLRTFGLLGVGR